MIFHFASIVGSGHLVEQEGFDSASFDRISVAYYLDLISKGEDFGEDLEEVHLEYLTTGPTSAIIEVSSEKGDVTMHLLGNSDPDAAMKELNNVLATIQNAEEPAGEIVQIKTRPLALAHLPEATPELLALSRYPIVLAAAFFETKST
jgi:hypothetical protein